MFGCATTPATPTPEIIKTFRTIEMGGLRFVSVNELCERLNLLYCWDGFSKTLILNNEKEKITLAVGSPYALVNDKLEDIKYPVEISEGEVVVPYEFAGKLSRIFNIPKVETPIAEVKEHGYGINTIILDPGHGGKDPGAIGRDGLKEKDVVLDIAGDLKDRLISKGFNVVATRESDRFIPLSERVKIANKNHGDLFISIHTNASKAKAARGVEVYYLSEQAENDEGADEETAGELDGFSAGKKAASYDYLNTILSELISTANRRESIEVANKVADSIGEKLFIRNRGVKRAKFIVLKDTRMPAILIEMGFITNRFEEKNLKNSYYRKMIVDAICDGITEFNNKYEEASLN